jgi:hypothetical protein
LTRWLKVSPVSPRPRARYDVRWCWRRARSCSKKIVVTLSVPTGQSLQTQSLQVTLSQVQDGCARVRRRAHERPCVHVHTLTRSALTPALRRAPGGSAATRELQEPLNIAITKSPVYAAYPLTYLKARACTRLHALACAGVLALALALGLLHAVSLRCPTPCTCPPCRSRSTRGRTRSWCLRQTAKTAHTRETRRAAGSTMRPEDASWTRRDSAAPATRSPRGACARRRRPWQRAHTHAAETLLTSHGPLRAYARAGSSPCSAAPRTAAAAT